MSQASKELEEFKDEIRSLLLSYKTGLQLREVNREYYNLIGKRVPYRALGFSSELELYDAIPDAVKIVNHGELFLYAVGNEKTAHIEKLVSKQKKPNSRTHSRSLPSRSRNTNSNYPPRMQRAITGNRNVYQNVSSPTIPPSVRNNVKTLLSRYPQGLQVQNFRYAYKTAYGIEMNHQDFNCSSILEFIRYLHEENVLVLREEQNFSVIYPVQQHSQHSYRNDVGPERVLNNDNNNVRNTYEAENETNDDNENEYINSHVLENLRKVVEHYPDGFPMTVLCEKYQEITGNALDLQELGYNNVQELVDDVGHIFRIHVTGDGVWLLKDAQLSPEPDECTNDSTNQEQGKAKKIPETIQRNIYDLLAHFPDGINLAQFREVYKINLQEDIDCKAFNYQSLESMLMSLDYGPPIRFERSGLNNVIAMLPLKRPPLLSQPIKQTSVAADLEHAVPDDAIVLGQTYTPIKVMHNEFEYFPVMVSSVDSPGKVWLQLVSEIEHRNIELDDLMNDLGDFYQSPEAERYRIPDNYLMNSLNCAVLYPEDQDWHRGCIIGKPGPTSYEVFYYDYGTICVVEKDLLRLLKKSFAALPAQAFCTRLARMKPLSSFYSTESASRLLQLCSGKPLMAQITSKTYMNTYSVILCDTNEDEDLFFNDILIKEGLVQSSSDQIDLRRPVEVSSPESYSPYHDSSYYYQAQMQTPLMNPNLQITGADSGYSSHNFYNPLGTSLQRQLNSSQLANNLLPHGFQSLVSTNAVYSHSLNRSLESNSAFDPEIARRVLEKKSMNLPKATVEPIQVSKPKTEDSGLTSPVTFENYSEANEQNASDNTERYDNQETEDVYDSSRDDGDVQEPTGGATSASASAVTNPSANQLRFCKKMSFRDEKFTATLINFNRQPCFTSADVSSFIFGVDIVKRILHIQKYPPCHIVVSREDQPVLFLELERSEVPGFTKTDSKCDKVVLYTLPDVLKILVFLNHNKETLVEDIEEIKENFNPDDDYWMTADETIKVDSYEQNLNNRLEFLKEERKALLRVMLTEDCSSIEDVQRLLKIHEDIHNVKAELSELLGNSKAKSASDQAREFLERAKLDLESEKSPEKTVSVTSTSVSQPVTTVDTENNISSVPSNATTSVVAMQSDIATIDSSIVCSSISASQNGNMMPVNPTTIVPQGYPTQPNSYQPAPRMALNFTAFYPNYGYPPQNVQFPPGMRYPSAQYYYNNQWKQ